MADLFPIFVTKLASSDALELQMPQETFVSDLISEITVDLEVDTARYSLILTCGTQVLDGPQHVYPLAKSTLTLQISKLAIVHHVGQDIPGAYKYASGGVLGANNCIYWAPCDAKQVLSVNTETGDVKMLGQDISGDFRYRSGGVLGVNNCIYWAPDNAKQVLCVEL